MDPTRGLAVALTVGCLLCACSTTSPAPSAEEPGASALDITATEVASVEGITEYRLPNGLRFLLFPDQSKQQITVNITYLVGSRHEGYGETGMAHLLEHLVFKGSTDHPNIDNELSERGAFANGTTWFDRTNYYETFPANEDNLDWALDLESDRMVNSFIKGEDLASEMTVVRNEWEAGENDPGSVLMERVMSTAYLWHNYGNSTIGARADIENVPLDRLQAFYRKYYQPDNAVLVVAGRFDRQRAVAMIEEKFGTIAQPERTGANQLFETYTAEPAQDGERTVTLRRVGDVQFAVAAYHVPAGSDEKFAAIDVLAHLMSNQPAGRLYKNLVEPGLAASAAAFAFQLGEPGLLLAQAQVRKDDDLDRAAEAMLATLHGVIETPPTEEEVNRAKTQYTADFDLGFNNPQSIALQLSEWAAMGDWRLLFVHRDRVAEVTPDDVLAVAKAYLLPSNRTLGYYYPTAETPARAEVPAKPDVAALVADYTGRPALAEGEAFEPTPENIERRTTKLTLDSGIEVALLPKQNRGGAVSYVYTFRHGTEDALAGKSTPASFAGSMLIRGTTERSFKEIVDEINRLKIRGSLSGGAVSVGGTANTVRENLPAALRLLGELMRQPAFDPDEFELLREERLASMEAQQSEPGALVPNAMQRHINSRYPEGHVFYVPTFEERIAREQAVALEQAKAFWSSFYGAEHGTLAIVGDFDPEEIVPVLAEAFGGWRANEPYERIARPFDPVEAVVSDIETPDKTNAFMYAAQVLPMRDDHPDYPALVLADYMLGGGFLNSRLPNRIRQQDGLSYGVGSSFSAGALDEVGQFMAYAIFAPENADKVVAAFKEEMARALASGFTDEEVTAAKKGYLDTAQNVRANDMTVAGLLAGNLFLDRTMDFVKQHEAAIAALTPADIHAALKRHIDLEQISIFRGGDFANKLVTE